MCTFYCIFCCTFCCTKYMMKYYFAPDSAVHSAPYSTIDYAIIFTQEILHLSLISKKKALFIIRNIYYLPHLYYFSWWMKFAIFQINTDLVIAFQNIKLFTQEPSHHSLTSERNWLSSSQSFLLKSLYISPSFQKETDSLPRKVFLDHPLYTTFSW